MTIEERISRIDALCDESRALCAQISETLKEYDAQAEKRAEHERQMQELLEKV